MAHGDLTRLRFGELPPDMVSGCTAEVEVRPRAAFLNTGYRVYRT